MQLFKILASIICVAATLTLIGIMYLKFVECLQEHRNKMKKIKEAQK